MCDIAVEVFGAIGMLVVVGVFVTGLVWCIVKMLGIQ